MDRILKSQTISAGTYYITDAKVEELTAKGGNKVDTIFVDDGNYRITNDLHFSNIGATQNCLDIESGELGIFSDIGTAKLGDLAWGSFINVEEDFQLHVEGFSRGCYITIVTELD